MGCIVNGPGEMAALHHLLLTSCIVRCLFVIFATGVAIAVMGCIVNGPGEMADADFGYVGGAPGKIDLYVGKEVVQRGIPMEEVGCCLMLHFCYITLCDMLCDIVCLGVPGRIDQYVGKEVPCSVAS
jgi:hypothetical protein